MCETFFTKDFIWKKGSWLNRHGGLLGVDKNMPLNLILFFFCEKKNKNPCDKKKYVIHIYFNLFDCLLTDTNSYMHDFNVYFSSYVNFKIIFYS